MTSVGASQLYCSRCLTSFQADVEQCPNLGCQKKRPTRGWGAILGAGEAFDRNYRIHRMLAMGGAGVTYTARELGPDGDEVGPVLAIKVLLAARDQGPYVRRLATEAQIIQTLDHPNIVQYLGFVHRSGHSPYLLTHYEEGGSLLDHMRRVGVLPVRRAAVVGRQICAALEKAHERGIIHRDLKPENVLLTAPVAIGDDPVIRVADFGIAKVQGGVGSSLTRVGAFVGTPHYASPEQFVSGAITEAADVYGVGALLFFTMMARHVIRFADRLDPEESFQLLCDSLPPKVERPTDDPVDVERMNRVLASAMAVDPAQRCTVVELERMLADVAEGREPVIPVRQRALPTTEISPKGSVLGLSAAVTPLLTSPLATDPSQRPRALFAPPMRLGATNAPTVAGTTPAPSALGGTGSITSYTGPVQTFSQATPSPTLSGQGVTPTADPQAAAPKSRGGVMLATAGLFLVFCVVFLGGTAIVLWKVPSARALFGLGGDGALEKGESDPARAEDFRAIDAAVQAQRSYYRSTCKLKKTDSITLLLQVGADGRVNRAVAESGGKAGSCVADLVQGLPVLRKPKVELKARVVVEGSK
jgi:serine/threonine protein kinase